MMYRFLFSNADIISQNNKGVELKPRKCRFIFTLFNIIKTDDENIHLHVYIHVKV